MEYSNLKNFCIDLRLKGHVSSRFNEILITKKENIEKFAVEINFSRGLKINGQRSNSVWKKSLEKRGILENLINSYKKTGLQNDRLD